MTSAASDDLPPDGILKLEPLMTLAEEEKPYHTLNDQKLAREIQWKDARSAVDWLSSALDVTRVVRDSSADVVSVLSSFVGDLSSALSIHGSDCSVGDLEQSLPSSGPAKQSWESVAGIINTLLNQIGHLRSAADSHIKCLDAELEAQNMIPQQSQMALVTLTNRIDPLYHSMNHRLNILQPIYRVPAEILGLIFEQATLEERIAVRAFRSDNDYLSLDDLYSTIPRIPTILASTCRRWRTVAFNMTRLWNFLRVPTFDTYHHPPGYVHTVTGISPFRQALSHLGASSCEVVVVPTADRDVVYEYLYSIPRSQISVFTIMMSDSRDFTHIPPARVLRIYVKGAKDQFNDSGGRWVFDDYTVPAYVLANTRELECHHTTVGANVPIHSVTSLSLNLNECDVDTIQLNDIFSGFPNLTAFTLNAIGYQYPAWISFDHPHIRKLSVSNSVIQNICQQGEVYLPSLTHFILLDIYPRKYTHELGRLQSLFVTVTHFDVRKGGEWNCGSYIRQILDLMPFLQQFSVFGTTVECCLDALLIAPIKQVDKLVILDSETDGSDVNAYYEALGFESTNCLGISIHFVNCPYILPHIREHFSCK